MCTKFDCLNSHQNDIGEGGAYERQVRAMLRLIEYVAKSLKVTQDYLK